MLETPIDDPGDDRRNVKMLWELSGRAELAPPAEKGYSMLTPALKKIRKAQRALSTPKAPRAKKTAARKHPARKAKKAKRKG